MNTIQRLWQLALDLITNISKAWEWLVNPLVINIDWIKIPLILPNGIYITSNTEPITYLGTGILILIALWFIRG